MLKFKLALVAFMVFSSVVFAQERVSFEKAATGFFQFPFSLGENDFVLWPTSSLTGGGILDGRITKKTVVKIGNRKMSREDLDLLTGKKVFVHGKFHQVGEGEGSYYHTDLLVIYLLPEEARGR